MDSRIIPKKENSQDGILSWVIYLTKDNKDPIAGGKWGVHNPWQ